MEKEFKPCPICGETIDSHAQICPICGETTGFRPTTVAEEPVEEPLPVVEQEPVEELVEEPVEKQVVPPPAPPAPPVAPAVEEPATMAAEKRGSMLPWMLLMLLLGIIIGGGLFLLFKDNKGNSQESVPLVTIAEQSAAEALDSIQKAIPVGAEMVLRVNKGDAPCLFYLSNGRFFRADGLTKETIEVDLPALNPEATVDMASDGILKATPTPDEKDILLLVAAKSNGEKGLYKFNVEGSRVEVLGKGEIDVDGTGYTIRDTNNERHLDNTGNMIHEYDSGLPEEYQTQEKKTESTPAKPKRQPKTEPEVEEPTPEQPAEPEQQPAENNGTGFHLEPV